MSPLSSVSEPMIPDQESAQFPRMARSGSAGKRKVRVGVFSLYYPKYRDAVFARLSRDTDFDFTFFAGPSPEGSFIRDSATPPYTRRLIRVLAWPVPGTHNLLTHRCGQLSALVRRRFDVLVLTNDVLGLDIWLCCLLSPLFGVPVCIWGQGLSRPPSRLRTALRYGLTSLAKAALYYSEGGRQYWLERGIDPGKLFVAYNALDTDQQILVRESLTPAVMEAFRAEQGLEGKTVVTFLGRLIAVKKPELFIDAVARTLESEPDLVGVLIGDGPEREALERRVAERGIVHAVRFLGESYDEQLLGLYLMASTAVVLPAAAGLAIQHAAVYGAPLILGDGGEHGPEREIVEEGRTGIWCPDGDVERFSAAILRLRRDPVLRDSLSVHARRVIEEKYNVARMAQGFLDALRHCVKK